MRTQLENQLLSIVTEALRKLAVQARSSAYALSFFIDPEMQDGPVLCISYNTEENFAEMKTRTSYNEARWNFAFWLQEPSIQISSDSNKSYSECLANWIDQYRISFSGACDDLYSAESEGNDFDLFLEQKEKLKNDYFRLCSQVAAELHSGQSVERFFGKKIPITIHDLEYSPESLSATKSGNEGVLIDDFLRYHSQ